MASLSRLSPSTSRLRRPGAPRSRKIATTAAGSVVAMIAASSKQTVSDIPASGQSASPTTAVVTRTAITASRKIGAASSSMRRTSIVSAASNSSAGRKMYSTSVDEIGKSTISSATSLNASVSSVCRRKAATLPIRTPTAARRTVGDRFNRAARGCSRPITTSRPATVNSVWDKPTMRRRGPSTSAVQEITIACAFLPAIRRILPPAMHVPPGPRAPSPRLRADSILGLPDRSEPVADLLRLPRGQVRVPIRPEGEACRPPAATRWSSHIGHAQPRRV